MNPPTPPPFQDDTSAPATGLALARDLLALTDAGAGIRWCNAAFEAFFGLTAGASLLALAPPGWQNNGPRAALLAAFGAPGATDDACVCLAAAGRARRLRVRSTPVDALRLWTLDAVDAADEARGESLASPAAQLRVATELADIVIWRHDLRTQRIHYNDHGFKVLGIAHRVGGLTLEEARSNTHPDDVPKLVASTAHALATGVPIDVEVRHRRGDGAWRDILVRRVIERGASGEPVAFVGVSLDVTDQVAHSRRAELLARRLEGAARAARIGVWSTVVSTLQTDWNAQMYELFDAIEAGETPPDLKAWTQRCVHPDDRARVAERARAYLRRELAGFEVEFRSLRRDGSLRWMVVRADFDSRAGDSERIFGIAMDVTERHEALAALHAASERAALIARHAGIGTWESAGDDASTVWDEQMWRLRGLPPGKTPPNREERLASVHPDDRAHVLDSLTGPGQADGPPTSGYEFRLRLPDGSYRWLASRSATLFDERGQVLRRVGVNWDVTEARSAELARQQVLLAERESLAKSQFLSRMSHELRTPLNAVLGFTQLLQIEAREGQSASQAARLDHIRSAGELLLALIDDALDLSNLQSGSTRLELQPVGLADAVALALPLVSELAVTHAVMVRTGPLDGVVNADPTRLRQVLLNLLTNAIKYNRGGGRVDIESSPGADFVLLRVSDNGRGMRPEQVAHLFEPFNRLGMEGAGIEGSGIGLTIVKALVEAMGGRVGVSSTPGVGTTFELRLPRGADAALPAPPVPEDRPMRAVAAAPRTGSAQLLYIEDNPVNLLLVEELVKTLPGLRLATAATGAAGVARALALRPDLILVDMQLPDFDGHEVLRRLRAEPATAAISCIALSANAMPEDIERALAAGFTDYWTKPIRFKAFVEALATRFPPPVTPRPEPDLAV